MKTTTQKANAHYTESAFNCYANLLHLLFERQPHHLSAAEFFTAVASLPESSQQILRLRHERGYKFTEIGIELHMRESAVHYWYNFGRNNLRRKLNPGYYHKKGGATVLQWVKEK